MKPQTHTARLLHAMQTEYAIKAQTEAREEKLHNAKRIAELTDDYLRWLHEQRQK